MTKEEAIYGAVKGSNDAQLVLYNSYKTKWYMICLRYMSTKMDAEDALQNGLINIFSKISQFDSLFGEFSAWSSKIMVNECIMLIRKNKKTFVVSELNEEYSIIDEGESSFERLSRKELISLIQKLPDGYRTVFNMFVIEGFTHKEISESLSITEGTSKSQLFKAKKMLKEALEIMI